MTETPTLENDFIKLLPVKSSDADSLFKAVTESINELIPWMPWCSKEYAFKESLSWCELRERFWKNRTEYDFAIRDKSDDSFLGVCGINKINMQERFANLGYWVRTGKTCQGIATAAVPLLAGFGFENLRLNRLEIIVAESNSASRRVAEKAGAVREGLLRKRLIVHNKVFNAFMFSLVREDLLPV